MPAQTDGFAFVEFTAPTLEPLENIFARMGFIRTWQHASLKISAVSQGDCLFFINAEPNRFLEHHGASARAIGVHVINPVARAALPEAVPVERNASEPFVIDAPAIRGIGESLIYLVDETPARFAREYLGQSGCRDAAIRRIDHTSNIVKPENLDVWADFYAKNFGFYQKQYLDVKGHVSGQRARSMVGRCGRVSIPIAASAHTESGVLNQNEEFIRDYGGEGIQHIALLSDDILKTVDFLRRNGIEFMTAPPDAYYDALDERLPGHGLDVGEIRRRGIMVDGHEDGRILLQIFTRRQIGPIFFEIIERRGEDGFGAGNFRALFEAQEKDQMRRGSLRPSEQSLSIRK
jgi:4-hydroxyphenylpyruvate dioxygenase